MIDSVHIEHEGQQPVNQLIRLGDLNTSTHPYVLEVKANIDHLDQRLAELSNGEIKDRNDKRIRLVIRLISWNDTHRGFGYLSSSSNLDMDKELLCTSLIAEIFRTKDEEPAIPLVIPIDDFYKFMPDFLSIVGKTRVFDGQISPLNKNYALILTGITDSQIFTPDVLTQVPSQSNADLKAYGFGEFGRKLEDFSTKTLPDIFHREKGNIVDVLSRLAASSDKPEDAKLLLVTALLLQDPQAWQSLWYEGQKKGTPLYIVAPQYFHDAMNRLNISWGHGAVDYRYRATNSLGAFDRPIFEDPDTEEAIQSYDKQGLPLEQFKSRVEKFI